MKTNIIRSCLIVPFVLLCQYLPAQVIDDFSDGDHIQNPQWYGDTDLFRVNEALQLQLDDTVANTASLYLPNTLITQTEWRFFIHIDFNPSSASWVKMYLASDSEDLNEPLNGYFLQFGEAGGTDAITLFRQQGDEIDTVARGSEGAIAEDFAMHIKITRDDAGNWTIFTDKEGNGIWEFETTGFDNAIEQTYYFGLLCKYAQSYSKRIYFDDFYVGDIEQDITPPEFESLVLPDDHSIDLLFSEALDEATAENTANYFVDQGIGNPAGAILDEDELSLVHLNFSETFPNRQLLTLTIKNLRDLAGNEMETVQESFSWFEAKKFDVLINEIMADPSPPEELPEVEYIELYNRTELPVNLKDWMIAFGNTSKTFPDITIPPDSFLIVTKGDNMSTYGLSLDLFTNDYSLTNGGTTLTLMSPDSSIIHHVSYDLDYYHDPEKDNGGWSMEMIDPENPCGNENNWYASQDMRGGTPGERNSVYDPGTNIPALAKVRAISHDTILVVFNQTMREGLFNPAVYEISNGMGHPAQVLPADTIKRSVFLIPASGLQTQVSYELTIVDTIRNCSGTLVPLESSMPFHIGLPAQQYDLVINELMADPSPAVELPEREYIELYNRTDLPVFLENWIIQVGDDREMLPDEQIPAQAYAIIADAEAYGDLRDYGIFAGVNSISLSNKGTMVALRSPDGRLIHAVEYDNSWYDDTYKEDGGYSLEQIDPDNPCGGKSNWSASHSAAGGTPGSQNSIVGENPDNTKPYLLRAFAPNISTIELYFNEPMDSSTIINPAKYHINNGIGKPLKVEVNSLLADRVVLNLKTTLAEQLIYTLSIEDACSDCAGNSIDDEKTVRVAIPKQATPNDLVINEILFNPTNEGVDFVELYNRSDKVIDMQKLLLTSMDTLEGYLYSKSDISDEGFLIFPEEYLVLTTAPNKIKQAYFTKNPDQFIALSSMPQFGNSEGTAVIADKSYAIIDRFSYEENMHFPLLNDTEGVSLERIDPDKPASDRNNWHSASETVGFATPAYQNSQFMASETYEDKITIDPEIFSPDNDGYRDVLSIAYNFGQPGFTANVTIYDAQGRLVSHLLQNELLGTSGSFTWDGITNEREKAPIGIYIIYFEVFDVGGKVEKFKKTAVLAGKMD
ncbi:MAG: lamin tail domain-containing protein [Bacteroidales bacterium]|nr:lamin tail domain-containing protein [Bacteroidales bacterium]